MGSRIGAILSSDPVAIYIYLDNLFLLVECAVFVYNVAWFFFFFWLQSNVNDFSVMEIMVIIYIKHTVLVIPQNQLLQHW